jgi:peroxiredoxin
MFWGAACANVFSACASAPPPPASSANRLLGEPLPAFERRTVQGGKVASDPARGLVVVDFFAEYCRPCQRSLPALEALHRARPELAIVGVSLDEDVIATRRTILRHGITFPVVHDPQHVLAGRFRVADLPICFLSDRGGRVRWVGGPEQPHGALARAVAAIIDGTKEE